MKKVTIITAVLALVLSGCGNADPTETEDILFTEASTQITESPETTAATEAPTIPVTEPAETQPAETGAVTEATEPAGETGTVTSRSLNIRESPSINAFKVGSLKYGDVVTVFEKETVNGMVWGRIDSGWVSMDYIRLGGEPIRQQDPETFQPAQPEESDRQEPTPPAPSDPVLPESVQKPEPIPQPENPQTPPAETKPAPSDPSENPAPTQPKVCQHHWSAIANIPAQYDYEHYVLCACGSRFPDAAAWQAHSDSFSGEELLNHTGYASGSDKTEVSPAMVTWKCDHCGITKTISAWDNP